ncbi:T9SS type A sorting domain-containing protein [Lewinella cohaerens]|uniref:T9SS type A sorting domain-containing protein n=1 Tax=Lewinella cohaerens TaxID=70995 RepID=UPI00039BC9FB|nr:T9SS type A sorting domain-containing protein [Lewinella cohaerens]
MADRYAEPHRGDENVGTTAATTVGGVGIAGEGPVIGRTFTAQSQNFTLSPNPIAVEADLETLGFPGGILAESIITNNTADTLFMKWDRILNDKPECWVTSVFGVWIQAIPTVNSLEFELLPNRTEHIDVLTFVDPQGDGPTAGEAEVVLKITNLNDAADTLLATYHFTVTGSVNCITSTSEIDDEVFKIYPNPSTDFFQLTETAAIQQLRVYDLLGQQVRQFEVIPNQYYDINGLPAGVYWVQLMGRSGEVIEIIKFLRH